MQTKLKNTAVILTLASLLFFAGEMPALASSTQVTFHVPVRSQGMIVSTLSTEVRCGIGPAVRNYVADSTAEPSEHFRGLSNWHGTVTVVVRAPRGVIFHKGDAWYCQLTHGNDYRGSMAPTSVLRVDGHL